jgi:hypothetical protein
MKTPSNKNGENALTVSEFLFVFFVTANEAAACQKPGTTRSWRYS